MEACQFIPSTELTVHNVLVVFFSVCIDTLINFRLDLKVDPSGDQTGLFQMGLNVAESLTNFVWPENAKNSVVRQPEVEVQEKQEVQLSQPEVEIPQLTQFINWTQRAA